VLTRRLQAMKTVDFTVAEVLGIRASPETLQLVSNATGAYVVAMPDDTVSPIVGSAPSHLRLHSERFGGELTMAVPSICI
jgi:hypothetical protein